MSLEAMYNQAKNRYAIADRFGSISDSHTAAINQIKNEQLDLRSDLNVLDFGVGTGVFLKQLHDYMPNAHYTGIDISKEMLARAKLTLPLKTIEASATEASCFLPLQSQDLVLAHFINAYIPLNHLFSEAERLTHSGSYFSFITTTYESFPVAQAELAKFIAEGTLVSTVVGHYYKTMVKNTTTAANLSELMKAVDDHHFTVVQHTRLEIPIVLHDIDEFSLFGIDGTWFLNSITMRMLPKNFLLERLKRLFSKIFTFPYRDTHIIDIILAKKNSDTLSE